jgi:putative flippase GtrA
MVGCLGIVIDFSVTWLLKEKVLLNKYGASAVGFAFAATSNYILNRYFTFQDTDGGIAIQFFKFFIISLAGLGLSLLLLWVLQKRTLISFYLSKAVAILIVFSWNYTANSLYTFSHQ